MHVKHGKLLHEVCGVSYNINNHLSPTIQFELQIPHDPVSVLTKY